MSTGCCVKVRGSRFNPWRTLNTINPIPGGGLRIPTVRSFLSHRQTAGASGLKLSDFVGTFIAQKLAKKFPGQVRSGHQKKNHVTRPLLEFEVVPKPKH